jgi:hypothetical protein
MLGGVTLIVLGLAAAAWGVRAATSHDRPRDLVGALVAPVGVAVAALGVAALLPGFWASFSATFSG